MDSAGSPAKMEGRHEPRTEQMTVYFEVLDTASGMMLKAYDTEAEALADLRAFGREHGQDQLQGPALLRVSNDRPSLMAMDDDLITLLYAQPPELASTGS
jgi:hypothetical protein